MWASVGHKLRRKAAVYFSHKSKFLSITLKASFGLTICRNILKVLFRNLHEKVSSSAKLNQFVKSSYLRSCFCAVFLALFTLVRVQNEFFAWLRVSLLRSQNKSCDSSMKRVFTRTLLFLVVLNWTLVFSSVLWLLCAGENPAVMPQCGSAQPPRLSKWGGWTLEWFWVVAKKQQPKKKSESNLAYRKWSKPCSVFL